MHRISIKKFKAFFVLTFASIFLTSCVFENTELIAHQKDLPTRNFEQLLDNTHNTEQKTKTLEGIQALRAGNYEEASHIFNMLLTLDPTNSGIHTLNALAYQLRAKDGDFSSYDLADAGYLQAKKFNPNNTYASLQLGRVKAAKKDYIKAQEEFAEVLLYDPQNEEALYELASVSYLMGDTKTARMSIDNLLKSDQTKPEYLRGGALIYAAQGDGPQAQKFLALYNEVEPKKLNKQYLAKRVDEWTQLHQTGNVVMAAATDAYSVSSIREGQEQGQEQEQEQTQVGTYSPNSTEPHNGMVVMDAVVLRIIDEGQVSKGNNILENFTLTLAPFTRYFASKAGSAISGANIFPLNNNSTGAAGGPTSTSIPGSVDSILPNSHDRVSLVTSGISFGAINYALNIANIIDERIEIIGRPTLTSHVGNTSEFFNGQILHIALSSTFGGGNKEEVPTGSTLNVTPTNIENDYVTLNISLKDSFLRQTEETIVALIQPQSPLVFSENSSHVNTTVKTKLGETIILGGTIERADASLGSGFPVLKDIPFVQYLFSSKTRATRRSSVLYFLTPRSLGDYNKSTRKYFAQMSDPTNRPNLMALEKRHTDWINPEVNLIPIIKTFGPLHQDFRLNDLMHFKWTQPAYFDENLFDLVDFLWD